VLTAPTTSATILFMRHLLATMGLLLTANLALSATQPSVDLEIVLAADASSSIDIGEYALQLRGIAAAFRDRDVQGAIAGGAEGRIAVNLLVWAQPGYDKLTTGWHIISTPEEAEAFAEQVEALPRRQFGGTGIGEGIEHSLKEIAGNGFAATRRVIDVSGDGRESWFAVATQLPVARRWAREQNVVINGLAITDEDPALLAYYDEDLRTGPGSFVLEAKDFRDFAAAMKIKLFREVSGRVPVASPYRHPGESRDPLHAVQWPRLSPG
jgi:hypothetical protein